MSKYSDYTTVGGQVLAHRLKMMQQNWKFILIIGKIILAISLLGQICYKWTIYDIWNYICYIKASWRITVSLPSGLFDTSTVYLNNGTTHKNIADTLLTQIPMFYEFKTIFEQDIICSCCISLVISMLFVILAYVITHYFGKDLTLSRRTTSGHDYVDKNTISKMIKNKSDIFIGNIPYVYKTEAKHTIITGTTGSGKTHTMFQILDQIVAKKEKIIIVDTVGCFVDRYYDNTSIILNPLDACQTPWSFLNECKNEILLKVIADCLISGTGQYDKFWEDAAKIVFVETAKKAIIEKLSTKEFTNILLNVPLSDIQRYLSNTPAYSLVDPKTDKMAISIRAILINALSSFNILNDGSFCIREWVLKQNNGILFLSCKPEERSALIPLITSWLSIACESIMHKQPTESRTWIFIDELHNLKRIPNIETYLAEFRKFGGCIVVGTQTLSQLDHIYGRDTTKTITGLCGTKVIMATPEPETAKYMSYFLGEKEEVSTTESISYGANTVRDGVNISQVNRTTQTVPYTEIMNLRQGETFIKLSGVDIVVKDSIPNIQEKTSIRPSDIHQFINNVRSQKAPCVIIEDGLTLFNAYFQPNTDFLIDASNECTYMPKINDIIKFLMLAANVISEEEKQILDIYVSKLLSNNVYTNSVQALQSFIFSNNQDIYAELLDIDESKYREFVKLKSKLAFKFKFLKSNNIQELDIDNVKNGIIFVTNSMYTSCIAEYIKTQYMSKLIIMDRRNIQC